MIGWSGTGAPDVLEWAEDRRLPGTARDRLTGAGAPFEMTGENVAGRRATVFARRPRSMRRALDGASALLGDRPYLDFPDRSFTYRSIHSPVASVAASLQDRFGVAAGDRVAICAPNLAGHALVAWATVSLGAVVVELNGWWTGAEMLEGIATADPAVVFGDLARLDRLPGGAVDVPLVCFEEDLQRIESAEPRSLPPDQVEEDDPLCILFTSGTTGRPKGAVLSHRNHANTMMQAALQARVDALLEGGEAPPPPGAPPPAGCTVGVSPMFHVSGFSVALISGPMVGTHTAYLPPGRWDPEAHLEATERARATSWSVVPTQLWRLLEHPRLEDFDTSSLRRIAGGGAAFEPELRALVGERLPWVTTVSTGYGMTETCGAGTHHGGRAAREHPDAAGAPVPGYSIAVRSEDGAPLASEETGVVHLRGASNFLGYWRDEVATREAVDERGWLRTADLGHLSDGLLYLDGRSADLIVRGGENVYPAEVERRLVEHPAVAEAAVVGEPDRLLGELVKAVVVTRPGASVGESELRDWAARSLAGFKVPAIFEFRGELPRNAAGKVLRRALREGPAGAGTGGEDDD